MLLAVFHLLGSSKDLIAAVGKSVFVVFWFGMGLGFQIDLDKMNEYVLICISSIALVGLYIIMEFLVA